MTCSACSRRSITTTHEHSGGWLKEWLTPASCIPEHEMTYPAFWNFSAKQISSSSITNTKFRIQMSEGLNHFEFYRTKGTICMNTWNPGKRRIIILWSKNDMQGNRLTGKQRLSLRCTGFSNSHAPDTPQHFPALRMSRDSSSEMKKIIIQNFNDLLDWRYLLSEISKYFLGLVTQAGLASHIYRHAFN